MWAIMSNTLDAEIKEKIEQVGVTLERWDSVSIYSSVSTGLKLPSLVQKT